MRLTLKDSFLQLASNQILFGYTIYERLTRAHSMLFMSDIAVMASGRKWSFQATGVRYALSFQTLHKYLLDNDCRRIRPFENRRRL